MGLRWQGFAVPKRGNSAEEYEDAFAGDTASGRFAVADGASESSFAGLWARLLVEGFTRTLAAPRSDWLGPLRQHWSAEVDGLDLPWYAEAKRGLGAAAAFLGLLVKRSTKTAGGIWMVTAVGDCCVFHVHEEQLVKAFPVTRSADFGNQPALVNSRPPAGPLRAVDRRRHRDKWRPGDRFFLMTDALAQWFLSRHEESGTPWRAIDRVLTDQNPDSAFASWIESLRDEGALRNDDVTVLIIDL